MFGCSMFGVVIVSVVVVTVTNFFELTPFEKRAHTIINKITFKNGMKEKAALIIGKMSRLHLDVKKNSKIDIEEIYTLSNTLQQFIADKREYENQTEEDASEEMRREIDRLKTTNKEVILYLSVLAKMIAGAREGLVNKISNESDRKIARVLLGIQDRDEFKPLKNHEINNNQVSGLRARDEF